MKSTPNMKSSYLPVMIDLYGDSQWEEVTREELSSYCKAAAYLSLNMRYRCVGDTGIVTVCQSFKNELLSGKHGELTEQDERIIRQEYCTRACCRMDNLLVGFDELQDGYTQDEFSDADPSVRIDNVYITPSLVKTLVARKRVEWIVGFLDDADYEERSFADLDSAILSAAKLAYARKLEVSFQAIQEREIGEFYVEQDRWEKENAEAIAEAIR